MSKNYTRITQTEFESEIEAFGAFERVAVPGTKELVYDAPANGGIVVRIFSSLNRDGKARNLGADAIRVVAFDTTSERIVDSATRTHRIESWAKNLAPKVAAMFEAAKNVHACADCGAAMARREGKFGPFMGCTAYPRCRHTEAVAENREGDAAREAAKADAIAAKEAAGVPRCVACTDFMVARSGKFGQFWGCANFPRCRETLSAKKAATGGFAAPVVSA